MPYGDALRGDLLRRSRLRYRLFFERCGCAITRSRASACENYNSRGELIRTRPGRDGDVRVPVEFYFSNIFRVFAHVIIIFPMLLSREISRILFQRVILCNYVCTAGQTVCRKELLDRYIKYTTDGK